MPMTTEAEKQKAKDAEAEKTKEESKRKAKDIETKGARASKEVSG